MKCARVGDRYERDLKLLLLDIEFPDTTNLLDRSEAYPLLRAKRVDCDSVKARKGGFMVLVVAVK